MIVVTKQGEKQDLPYLYAYEDGLFSYPFYGDESYTDPFDDSVWTWDVDNDLNEIIGVVNGAVRLIRTISVNDCKALEKSYFWDDTAGVLYIHWVDNVNDYTKGRDNAFYSSVIEGYSSGYSDLTNNIFDGIYYPSVITAIGGLARTVDPLKFGVLSFDESSLTITNQNGTYDNLDASQVVGQPIFFYQVSDTDTELTDDMKIFSGFYTDFKNDKGQVNYKIVENRLFGNAPVCPNIADITTYPDIAGAEDSVIPTAWGDIRRGKMLLLNADDLEAQADIVQNGTTSSGVATIVSLDDTSGMVAGMSITGSGIPLGTTLLSVLTPSSVSISNNATATNSESEITFIFPAQPAEFLLADPALNDDGILLITAVYDEDDNEITISVDNKANCRVIVEKLASLNPSQLKKWTWEGRGYDIPGTYNNGLDIIKDAFLKLASIPYLVSTFNTTEWAAATAANLEDIGISLQSTRGFTEELIQPVTVSIQGILEIQGDGRISWKDRDITASPSATIEASAQTQDPVINEDSSQIISELVVEYSQNFVDKDDKLIFVNSDYQNEVIANYSIDRRDPISPVKTLLTTESDADSLSEEIMSTSASPNRIIDYDSLEVSGLRVFDIACVDTGRYGVESLEYGEILSVSPDYMNFREKAKMRVIPNYVP